MRRLLLLISFQLIFAAVVFGQVAADSSGVQKTDSLYRIKDSVGINLLDSTTLKTTADTSWKINSGITLQKFNQEVLKKYPFFGLEAKPLNNTPENIIKVNGKESLFYLLVGLLLFLAFLRRTFPKYFSDLFRLFFRTTMKQRQIREQLMQTPLPSLLMNGFFVVSSGLYVSFLLHYFGLQTVDNFWLLFLYCCLGVAGVYFAVWAPNAKSVSVIGNFNHWDRHTHPLNVRWDGCGIWDGDHGFGGEWADGFC